MTKRGLTLLRAAGASAAAVLLGVASLLPLPVVAAAPLDEIVVTARRLPERLQDVPLSLDVIVRADLAAGAVDSLQSLIARAPGLYYETAWGGLFSAPSLRGQQPSPTGDLNVGVFVDGVYQADPSALDPGVLDFERIEIARGPQSTLFGHSTFAGAIHYVTPSPSATGEYGFTVDAGSDSRQGANGFVSGPLLDGGILGRFAMGADAFDGTHSNASASADLGGWRRWGAAFGLVTAEGAGGHAGLTVRFNRRRSAHPAVSALTHVDYNCGAIESQSGAWSYFCGDLPLRSLYDISPGIPDSENEAFQSALALSWTVGGGELESRSSFYRGTTDSYRDFDVSSAGELYGVCTVGANCEGAGPRAVNRLVTVNEVSRTLSAAEEWSQELRWQSAAGDRWSWMLGATAWWIRERDEARLGAARGDLLDNELLTAVLPRTPFDAGPVSLVNSAIVDDPNGAQRTQALDDSRRRTFALFAAADYELTQRIRARAELRATRERRTLDNRIANFVPGFGTSIGPRYFDDVTPRLTIQYLASDRFGTWLSAAKGSQSGGINAIPGLLPGEQVYDPEYNWTYELGSRYSHASRELDLHATLYYIDWRDTQMLGFPDTLTVTNLITRNTKGLTTRGLEISVNARLHDAISAELDWSYTDPAFRAGSDDPGSRRFCGLAGGGSTSSFCTAGPARSGSTAGLVLVPYIDGNLPGRTPQRMWHAAIVVQPLARADAGLVLRVDANGQDDVFDRPIGGARFGSRTLLDARLTYTAGHWSFVLWGRNLGDVEYIRALASRGQVFFPTTPRPLDMLYGDGRTFGLTVSFAQKSS